MNLRIKTIVFFLSAFVVCTIDAKPQPSLSMVVKWEDRIQYGQAVNIQVEIFSQIESDELKVTLKLPEGVSLIDGESLTQSIIHNDRSVGLDYTVIIGNDASGYIEVDASIGNSQEVVYRAVSHLLVGRSLTSQKRKTDINELPIFRRTVRNGVSLREYLLP